MQRAQTRLLFTTGSGEEEGARAGGSPLSTGLVCYPVTLGVSSHPEPSWGPRPHYSPLDLSISLSTPSPCEEPEGVLDSWGRCDL